MSVDLSQTTRITPRSGALRRLSVTLRTPTPVNTEFAAVALGPYGALSGDHLVSATHPTTLDDSLALQPTEVSPETPRLTIALDRLDQSAWAVAMVVAVDTSHAPGTVAVVVVHDDEDAIREIELRELGGASVAVFTIASRDYDDWELAPERVEYAVDVTQALASIGVQTHDDGDPE